MTGHYAVPVHLEVYIDNPEYTSVFRPRIHRKSLIADHASLQCQLDLYGDESVGRNFGSLNGHVGNFTSLCAPNCMPERLALVSYTIEYAFLHDDITDNASDETSLLEENRMLLQALNQGGGTLTSTPLSEAARRKSEVQAKIAAEYLRLDPEFGRWFLSYWEKFTQSMHDVRSLEFATLDDYLAFRVVDAAAIWTLSILRWGTGIYLSPDEERIAGPMSYVAYAALSLTNDLFSWEKEYRAYVESDGKVPLVNAVHVVMLSDNISPEAAKAVIRSEIREHEKRFCELREQYKAEPTASGSIIDWLTLLEDSMAGNFVWSLEVPRYRKIDGNPYHDHLNAFRKDTVKVLTQQTHLPTRYTKNENGNSSDLGLASETMILNKPFSSNGLSDEVLRDPYTYISSLPSKNIRKVLITALNSWYKVADKSLLVIEGVVSLLHNSSLLLDDIQDGSALRRGRPVAHQIFGIGQTINSATYLMNEALGLIQMLSSSAIVTYFEEMRNLHIGQGHDIHWSYHTYVPTHEEYISMVDGKTGGLLRLLSRLMQTEAQCNKDLDLSHFATLFGRYFQIRDDYQNLNSAKYTQEKGFCDDLDEGKLSFPVLLAVRSPGCSNSLLLSTLQSCNREKSLSTELKKYLLEQISYRGGLSQTKSVLNRMHAELLGQLTNIEKKTGTDNWALRLLIMKLDTDDEDDEDDDGRRGKVKKNETVWKQNQRRAWADSPAYKRHSMDRHLSTVSGL